MTLSPFCVRLPTSLKNSLNFSSKSLSFEWSSILNSGCISQLVFTLLLFWTPIKKQPSASVKPVINQGSKLWYKFLPFKLFCISMLFFVAYYLLILYIYLVTLDY